MSLINSLFSGVSGLRNHQSMMDNIGNNIANVNTIGYKSTRITFSDTFNQFIRYGSDPDDIHGGTNAFQLGLGSRVNSIDRDWSQGTFERTGFITDIALQGKALFVLENNGEKFYSRAGAFTFDSQGNLVNNQNGGIVLGKNATKEGVVPPGNNLEKIVVNKNERIPAVQTTEIQWEGNLNSSSPITRSEVFTQTGNINTTGGTTLDQSSTIYNTKGEAYRVTVTYTNTGANAWNATYQIEKKIGDNVYGPPLVAAPPVTPVTFDPVTGAVTAPTAPIDIVIPTESIDFDLDISRVTQKAGARTLSGSVDTNREPTIVDGTISIFDSLGNSHVLTVRFTKLTNNVWEYKASMPAESGTLNNTNGSVTFDNNGSILVINPNDPVIEFQPNGGASQQNIHLDFGSGFDGITQSANKSVVSSSKQNGSEAAVLSDLSIDKYGFIMGVFSNGTSKKMAQILLAKFPNNSGLISVGENMFKISANAGDPIIGDPGEITNTTIQSRALEQSNVDLSEEFTKMIIAQRGFQSNARVITTSDNLLQEITNLVR